MSSNLANLYSDCFLNQPETHRQVILGSLPFIKNTKNFKLTIMQTKFEGETK